MGIDYYSGIIRGAVTDYYQWQLSEDGITKTQNTYVTEALTNTSIDWINQQTKPWFMWLAYNAPHTPCLLYTSPSPRDRTRSRMPSSA